MSCLQPKQKIGISTLPPDPHPHPPNCWEVVQVWTGQKRMFRGYPKKGTCITAFIFHIYYTWNHFMPSWMMKVSLKSPHRSCPKHIGSFQVVLTIISCIFKITRLKIKLLLWWLWEKRENSPIGKKWQRSSNCTFFFSSAAPYRCYPERTEASTQCCWRDRRWPYRLHTPRRSSTPQSHARLWKAAGFSETGRQVTLTCENYLGIFKLIKNCWLQDNLVERVRSTYAEPNFLFIFLTHLEEEVDLLPRGADRSVKPIQSLGPVLEA